MGVVKKKLVVVVSVVVVHDRQRLAVIQEGYTLSHMQQAKNSIKIEIYGSNSRHIS
jgi:hypothetical protein